MIYNKIIIDSSNLFWRVKGNFNNTTEIIKKMIFSIDESLQHLTPDGTLYLLFDILTFSDPGQKAFQFQTWRQKLLPDYKANRERSKLFLSTISFFRKYYTNRGDQIQLVYSDEHEADDFVQPLIEKIIQETDYTKNKTLSIALLSNDYDWSSFITNKEFIRVDLINNQWSQPMREQEFIEKFKFKPTYSSIIFYKACFGDKSDNIAGAIFIKKANFNVPIKEYILDCLIEIGEKNIHLEDLIKSIKDFKVNYSKENISTLDRILFIFKSLEHKCLIIQTLLNNIACLQSSLKDQNIDRFIHINEERPKTNQLLYESVFGQKFINSFGKI